MSETSGQERIPTEVCLDELEEERIPDESEEIDGDTEIEAEAEAKTEIESDPADAESMLETEEFLSEPELDVPDPSEGEKKNSAKAEWSRQYKLARSYLYGSNKVPQDFQEAMDLLRLEAEQGNALAMYDLGQMWADGLGVEADPDVAKEWYRKALNAFFSAEKELPERKKTYLQYRIGKMYLAGLYAKGQGVEKDLKHAFELYHASAIQGNPYASYELAKMFRDGTGTVKSAEQAEEHFQDAFSGFLVLEEQSHDDKLQYRLGQMLYQGIGTEKDEEEAVRYWQQAAKLGNVNAQYALGKFWLDTGTGDVQQAAAWLEKAADAGNTSAQYVLAKLYLESCLGEKNAKKAGELFQKAAEKGKGFAVYRLGRLYLEGEDIPKDIVEAVRWLTEAAEQELPFAQYTLGCLYLKGEEIPKDTGKAVAWLRQAALQGNEYAQYRLGSLYLLGEDVPQDLEEAVRWLELAADQGNQCAQYALGKLFLYGQPGMPCDKEKAVPLLEAAAA